MPRHIERVPVIEELIKKEGLTYKKSVSYTHLTGVGKTDLSIKLAKLMKADIFSADSAQVYKGMNIGTAKITAEEMQGIKHYMLDICLLYTSLLTHFCVQ